jgi:hypothetical protein
MGYYTDLENATASAIKLFVVKKMLLEEMLHCHGERSI